MWPKMVWNSTDILQPLGRVRQLQGMVFAKAGLLGFEFLASQLENEAIATAAIENIHLDRRGLRSSIARRLGMETAGLGNPDRYAEGLVQTLMDATENHTAHLTSGRLKSWQASLFPTGYSGLQKIVVGEWRKGSSPMQVVSGPHDKETIHFEAPPAIRLEAEMRSFLDWFNSSKDTMDGLVRAAQTHLYFVTIHPFEDGNGRVARAVADMAIAQDDRKAKRFFSISAQIFSERSEYYDVLEKTQKGNGDITEWLVWFFECMQRALVSAQSEIERAGERAELWLSLADISLNSRQKKVINKLSEYGRRGFKGGLTNRKYRSMVKTSRETAKRDIADLLKKGVLHKNPGKGRSVNYSLIWPTHS